MEIESIKKLYYDHIIDWKQSNEWIKDLEKVNKTLKMEMKDHSNLIMTNLNVKEKELADKLLEVERSQT